MPSLSSIFTQSLEGIAGGPKLDVFYENKKVITENYTIDSTKHAMSTGPITIADNVTVTIPDGSRWVII
jgi:hypothetical protein